MNNTNKSRLLTIAIVLLIAANVVALVLFWRDKKSKDTDLLPPPMAQNGGSAFDFLTKELALDSNQIKAYSALRDEQRKNADPLKKAIRDAKDSLFGLLKKSPVNEADLQNALNKEGAAQIALDKSTFQHFQNVRKLCTPQQQLKFDSVIQQAMQMFGQPNRRPPMDRPIEKDTAKRRPPRDRINQNNDGDMNPPPRELGPDGHPPHPPRDKDGRPLHPPRDKDGKPMHPPRDGKGHPPPPPDEM